jgi:hypothetical protein
MRSRFLKIILASIATLAIVWFWETDHWQGYYTITYLIGFTLPTFILSIGFVKDSWTNRFVFYGLFSLAATVWTLSQSSAVGRLLTKVNPENLTRFERGARLFVALLVVAYLYKLFEDCLLRRFCR